MISKPRNTFEIRSLMFSLFRISIFLSPSGVKHRVQGVDVTDVEASVLTRVTKTLPACSEVGILLQNTLGSFKKKGITPGSKEDLVDTSKISAKQDQR